MIMTEKSGFKKQFDVASMFNLKPEQRKIPTIYDLCVDMNVSIQECMETNNPAYDIETLYGGLWAILTEMFNGRHKVLTPKDVGAVEVFIDNVRLYLDKFLGDTVEDASLKLYFEEPLQVLEGGLKIRTEGVEAYEKGK